MELWITFIVASSIILIVPGPTVILVVSQSLAHGRGSTIPLVTGVLLGDCTVLVASLLGLGTLITASATLFTCLTWLGALYLVYMGAKIMLIKTEASLETLPSQASTTAWSLFRSSYIVTVFNPSALAFFIAFLPQFIDPTRAGTPQLVALGGIFLVLATINSALYAVFALQLKGYIGRPSAQKWFNRCGGGALIGAGIITLIMK